MSIRWQATPWADLGLAAFLLFFGLMGTGPAAADQGQDAPVLSYVLMTVAALSIALWRWRPLWTFVLAGSAAMVYIGLGYAYGPILVSLALAVYGLAARRPIRLALYASAALLAASVVAVSVALAAGERDWPDFVSVAAWVVIPAAVGVAVKIRRDATAEVRAEQARRAVSEERLQLAQEVHDIVGHGLAVIAMQAGVALRVVDRDPGRTRAALEAIRATSQEALDGLRAELRALRGEPGRGEPGRGEPGRGEPGRGEAPRRPGTGLADLPALADRVRASGLPVTVDVDPGAPGRGGAADGVPAEVDHAAYRIVQESLTNVLRHGGPDARAQVRVSRTGRALRVEVLDTGRGAQGVAERGHGIAGMRERARALGGTLEAGPRATGGFAVRAVLPYARPAANGGAA